MASLYRALARLLLPPAFRRDYGHEIESARRARLEATDGWRRIALWAHEIIDLLGTSVREWRRALTDSTRDGIDDPQQMTGASDTDRRNGLRDSRFHLRKEQLMGILADLRIAARNVTRRPALAVGVTLTIEAGVGAITTIYGVVDGVVLRLLPYDAPSALVAVGSTSGPRGDLDPETGLQDLGPMSSVDYRELMDRASSFERIAAVLPSPMLLSEEDGLETYDAAASSHG